MKSCAASYSLWQENAPPKPPRGRNREPVACPLQDATSSMNRGVLTPKNKTVFRARDAREQLIQEFVEGIGCLSSSVKFCGRDGLDIMKKLVQQKNPSWDDAQLEEKAIMMLDHWLKESVIRALDEDEDDDDHIYVQNRKVFYALNPSEKHRVLMITPRVQQGRSVSRDRGPRKTSSCSRRGSFKRLFGFGGSLDMNDENLPANLSPTSTEDEDQSRSQSPRIESRRLSIGRIIANAFNYTKDAMDPEEDMRQLSDDALLFEMALKRLLLVIDVSFVDDIISMKNAEGEGVVSYLSTILRKIGLKSDCEHSDDTTVLLSKHIIKNRLHVLNWFKAAVDCSPSMQINNNIAKCVGERDMLHILAKQALAGVVDYLNSFTNCGQHPLIPTEFEALLSSIASQQFRSHSNLQTRDEAIIFLWLMIPKKMRSLLDRLLRLLDDSKGTDSYFSLNDASFWKPSKGYENSYICLSSLRKFIFPQAVLSTEVQDKFIEILIVLKRLSTLDQIPPNIRQDIEERKLGREKAPVQYCQDDSKGKAQKDINEIHIVNMINQMKECKQFSDSKKKEWINTAKKQYPEIFRKHFPYL